MKLPFRFLIPFVLLAMVIASCGGDDNDDAADPTATSVAEDATPTEVIDEATPTSEPEPTPTDEPEPTAEPTVEPTVEPTIEPTPEDEGGIPDTPAGQQLAWFIEALNAPDPISEDEFNERFSDEFIAVVPFVQFVAGMAQVSSEYGPFTFDQFLEPPTDTQLVARLDGTTDEGVLVAMVVQPTEPYLIDFLQALQESALDTSPIELGSWDELEPILAELAPQASFQVSEVAEDGGLQPIHAINPDERLGVGSAFKLYILGELARQVEAGTVSWDDELELREEWKSLPTGTMQDEPAGSIFTLREYADLMISISDNTATDHLLYHLGRENVEAMQAEMGHGDPSVNTPMLATRELFILKMTDNNELRQRYIDASEEERRQILEEEVGPQELDPENFVDWLEPRDIDTVEWFASTAELSAALTSLREMSEREGLEPVMEILSINPGIEFDPVAWPYVGFKGGAELGVLNFNWLLQRDDGRWFTLSVTVNDPDNLIDENMVVRVMSGAALLLQQEP